MTSFWIDLHACMVLGDIANNGGSMHAWFIREFSCEKEDASRGLLHQKTR